MKKISKPAQAFYNLLEQEGYRIKKGFSYIKHNVKIAIERIECGHESFEISPEYFKNSFFKNRSRCPECAAYKNTKKRTKKFSERIKRETNGEYISVGLHLGGKKLTKIKHIKCGHEFTRTPANALNYPNCPKCHIHGNQKSLDEFKQELHRIYGDEYKVVGEYTKSLGEIELLHTKCNKTFHVRPNNMLMESSSCTICSPRSRISHDEYKDQLKELGNGEYELLSEYKKTTDYVRLKHRVCGHEWNVIAISFSRGHRCPKCMNGKSHDAIKIDKLISETDLFYLDEYTIEKCRNIRPLPFDFAIIDKEKLVLIEYDGQQHFEPIEAWGGEVKHQEAINRDNIKNQYCIDHNIPLVRIPYWETDNVEYIVKNVLAYFNLIKESCEDRAIVEKYYVKNDWRHENYYNSPNLVPV